MDFDGFATIPPETMPLISGLVIVAKIESITKGFFAEQLRKSRLFRLVFLVANFCRV